MEGVSPDRFVSRVLENTLGPSFHLNPPNPSRPGTEYWPKYGTAPPRKRSIKTGAICSATPRKNLMIAGVADTHTAPWYLFGDSRLTIRAKEFIDQRSNDRPIQRRRIMNA